MKRNLASTAVPMLFAAFMIVRVIPATAQTNIEQFLDAEYEYSFQYPSSWPIRKMPEGEANKEVRVALQGPNGSSFMVVFLFVFSTITINELPLGPCSATLTSLFASPSGIFRIGQLEGYWKEYSYSASRNCSMFVWAVAGMTLTIMKA